MFKLKLFVECLFFLIIRNVDYTKIIRKSGFTLIEILMVAVCLVLVSIPLITILQTGTRSSLAGILRVETVLEARKIIKQVQADIKSACFPFSAASSSPTGYSLANVIQKQKGKVHFEYYFLSFPFAGPIDDYIKQTDKFAYRCPSLIHYYLEKNPEPTKPFFRLIREEIYHKDHPARGKGSGKRITVLSDRVNLFKIDTFEIETVQPFVNQPICRITLQLVESMQAKSDTKPTPDAWQNREEGYIIADFFDVVFPEFLNAIRRKPFMNRAWHNWTDWKD